MKHKNDLIAEAAAGTGVTHEQARQLVNNFLTGLMNEIAQSHAVELRGFGSFKVDVKPGREVKLEGLNKPGLTGSKLSNPFVFVKFNPMENFKQLVLENHQCKSSSATSQNSAKSETSPTIPSSPTSENSPV